MQDLYEKFTAKSDMTVRPTKNENGGFHFRDYQQFQMIAQQTTGGEVHQLHTEVVLNFYTGWRQKMPPFFVLYLET